MNMVNNQTRCPSPPSVVQRLERSALALRAHLVDLHQLYDATKDEDLLHQQADISRRYTQVLNQLCDALRPPRPQP